MYGLSSRIGVLILETFQSWRLVRMSNISLRSILASPEVIVRPLNATLSNGIAKSHM